MATAGYSAHLNKVDEKVLQLSGQYTATIAEVMRFPASAAGRLKYLSVTAQASGGTSPTLTVDIQQGTTSLLDAPVAVTAGTDTEAVLATSPVFAKDAVLTIDLTIGGTSPTWDHITIFAQFEKD